MEILLNTIMLGVLVVLFSVDVVTAVTTECHYKDGEFLGHTVLNSMYCEDGCCGTTEKQECCSGLNYWMVFSFFMTGMFVLTMIVMAVLLIIKQKNKKKEQVGTRNQGAFIDQPNTVDMSIFRTHNSATAASPEYSAFDKYLNTVGHTTEAKPPEYSALDKYLERSEHGLSTLTSSVPPYGPTSDPTEYPSLGAMHNHPQFGRPTTEEPSSNTLMLDNQGYSGTVNLYHD